MRVMVLAVLLAACGHPSVNNGNCAGTAIAGTCLDQFFSTVNACFQPSGACVQQLTPAGPRYCWPGGARLMLNGTAGGGMGFTYTTSGNSCFYGSWVYINGTQKDYTFTIDGNALLVYNRTTGETTCLDGTHTTLAPDFGGCAAFQALVDLTPTGCTDGTC
jgi:hypothetical protein